MFLEPIQLEEYKGHQFFVEHVSSYPNGNWFRIHMTNGNVHNLTIGYAESIDAAKDEVVKSFKNFLNK